MVVENSIFLIFLWVIVVCIVFIQIVTARELGRLDNENRELRQQVADLETLANQSPIA